VRYILVASATTGIVMAARATGSGTISFGLVSIPVKLYPTVDTTKTIRFNYLAKDGSRLKQQYIRASDGEVVPNDERVQGYEFAKGQYVLFDDDELKAMRVDSTNAIEITEFVPLDQVERLYIERVYYMGPDKGAGRSYHLLKEAMRETGRAALAKYAARGKSYLVLLRPMDDGIIMEQLKHQEELRSFSEVPLDKTDVNSDELKLAITIIDQVSSDEFQPQKYTDEIREKMLEMIQRKVDGQDISVPPEEKAETKIIDLMEALKASVSTQKAAPAATPARANRKASARKASRKS
jgi:DNA end-binding protein Ku